MPFKSEAQRKYLWANEPEIARDWTDTYGSGIQAAQGGRIPMAEGWSPGVAAEERESRQEARQASRGPIGRSTSTPTVDQGHTGEGWQTYAPSALKEPLPPSIPRGERINTWLNKKMPNLRHRYNFNKRGDWISKNRDKLIAAGLIEEQEGGPGAWNWTGPGDLTSMAGLRELQDLGYTGGFGNANDPRSPNYDPSGGGGVDPYPYTGIASVSTPDTTTASTDPSDLYAGSYRLDPRFLLAADGGMIGSVGGTSRQKYQGGEIVGAEMEGAEMEGAMMQSKEVIKELYDALIAQGLSPQEAMEKIKEIIASSQTQGPQSPMMGEEFPGQEFGRAPAAFGGMMDTYTGRRKYGLGSLNPFKAVKKAVKKVKEIASSKLGKIALGYLATAGLANVMAPGAAQWGGGLKPGGWLRPGQVMSNLSSAWAGDPTKTVASGYKAVAPEVGSAAYAKMQSIPPIAQQTISKNLSLPSRALKYMAKNPMATILGGSLLGAGVAEETDEVGGVEKDYNEDLAKWEKILAPYKGAYRVEDEFLLPAGAAQGGRIGRQEGGLMANMDMIALEFLQEFGYDMMLANPDVREDFIQKWKEKNFYDKSEAPAEKRVMAQEGGLMNLGGMEKDYRNDGGFVPLGGEEKADDVPARLSRNEFVFTADAVRNAGGGDIDRGAEVMENVMKNLEGGGKISEESQGQGAQEMFEVSERLSEVI